LILFLLISISVDFPAVKEKADDMAHIGLTMLTLVQIENGMTWKAVIPAMEMYSLFSRNQIINISSPMREMSLRLNSVLKNYRN